MLCNAHRDGVYHNLYVMSWSAYTGTTCSCTAMRQYMQLYISPGKIGSVVLWHDLCTDFEHFQNPTHKHNTNQGLSMACITKPEKILLL